VIFGFGKSDDDDDEYEEDIDLVLFQGAYNDAEVDITEHAKLAQAGLLRAKEIVSDAIERRGEKLRIEPKGERAIIQIFVDGVGYSGGKLRGKEGIAVVQVLKLIAGLDIKNRKDIQKGGIHAEFDDVKYLLMIETKPVGGGLERLTMQIVDVKNVKYSPADLGFSQEIISKIRELASGKGMVLAAGPRDSDLIDLTFAIARGVDAYVYGTFALLDVGHRDLGSVSKFERREGEALDTVLQRLIRQDADIAYVEPITSEEILKTLLEKQEEIVIISEVYAKDAAAAIAALAKQVEPETIANAVEGVFGQRWIRKLCEKCKQPYRPNPKLIRKVGLPEETQTLYRPPQPEEDEEEIPVCRVCGGANYMGRVPMIELVEMTDGVKKVVTAGGDAAAIKAQARKEDMPTFKDDGLRLVAEGVTSLEELQRVFRSS